MDMTMTHKRASLPELKGVLFTDPSYEQGTWCRYEADINPKGWVMDYRAQDCDDDGYRFASFMLLLASPETASKIKFNEDLTSFSHPASMKAEQRTVGMDTACVYIGPAAQFDPEEWQPSCALRTGTDGEFGAAYELASAKGVEAIVLFGFIDADFGSAESVWEYLLSSFEAVEED